MKIAIKVVYVFTLIAISSSPILSASDNNQTRFNTNTDTAPVRLYFGRSSSGQYKESFPVYEVDFLNSPDNLIRLFPDEWQFNTRERFVIDAAKKRIIYPRAAGVFQLEILDLTTGKSNLIEKLQKTHVVSYRPAYNGDTMAVSIIDFGTKQVIAYDLAKDRERRIDAFSPWAGCDWPAITLDGDIFAVCLSKDGLVYKIVSENGHTPYQSMNPLSSMTAGQSNIYWVEGGKVMKMNRTGNWVKEINLPYDIYVKHIFVTDLEGYIAISGRRGNSAILGVLLTNTNEFIQVDKSNTDENVIYGMPVMGPALKY